MRQSVATRPVDGDAGTHGLIYAQALTACFAGPVFNLLVTLGVGFLIRLDNFQERRMRVASNDGISVGLGMIIANCVCVVGAGLLLAGRVPKQFGFFSVGLYVLYLVIAPRLRGTTNADCFLRPPAGPRRRRRRSATASLSADAREISDGPAAAAMEKRKRVCGYLQHSTRRGRRICACDDGET